MKCVKEELMSSSGKWSNWYRKEFSVFKGKCKLVLEKEQFLNHAAEWCFYWILSLPNLPDSVDKSVEHKEAILLLTVSVTKKLLSVLLSGSAPLMR